MASIEQGSRERHISLSLRSVLEGLYRMSPIPGMEGEEVSDPIAQDILSLAPENIAKVELFLVNQGVKAVTPLKDGYGFSAVVLDAGDKVVRLSRMEPTKKLDEVPLMLLPDISEVVGGVSIQISKKLNTSGITESDVQGVQETLRQLGYCWNDSGTDNLGRDEHGKLFIIDGGVEKIS